MNSFLSAFGFLTILPVPTRVHSDGGVLAYAWMWFPLVGLFVGLLAGVIGWSALSLGVPALLAATFAVATLVLITRGFHYDGFSDTVDASLGSYTIEGRLKIMKDPHVGSFAATGLVLIVLLQVQLIAQTPAHDILVVMAVAGLLSRWGVLWPMFWMAYAKQTGLGLLFKKSVTRYGAVTGVTAIVLGALGGVSALLLIPFIFITALALGRFAQYRFGGLTGDVCGFIIVLLELAVLAAYLPLSSLLL